MSEYVPVPVDAARLIAHQYAKDVVVIVCQDSEHGQVHTTTYGKQPADKILAAELGPVLAAAMGGFMPEAKPFEDFREAAENAATFEEALRLIEDARCVLSAHAVGHATQGALDAFVKKHAPATAAAKPNPDA